MAKKNIYNINAIRPALIAAHNNGNKKNLTRDMLEGAGIQGEYFAYWQQSVETLRTKVVAYVNIAWNQKFDSKITAEQVSEARNEIYPAYKDILSQSEADKETKKLHVDETDVERLIKFAWNFTSAAGATTMVNVEKKKFRLEVEKLMGCIITQAEILSDSDRDKLNTYNKNAKSVEKGEDRIAEIKTSIKALEGARDAKNNLLAELGITGKKAEEITSDITAQIVALNNERKALDQKISDAKAAMAEVADDVKAIRLRVQYSGK